MLRIISKPSQNVLNFDLKCPIGQSDPFRTKIWCPWFGKLQMKQLSDLDDARESPPSEHIKKNHNRQQTPNTFQCDASQSHCNMLS